VTGASSGIGAEIARELARRDAHVLLVARRADRLADLADEIRQQGGQATPLPCDIIDESAVQKLVRHIAEHVGQIHLLVNNAGKELFLPLQVAKSQAVRDLLEVNVVALAGTTRHCLRLFQGGGAVVNMASAVGLRGSVGQALYGASKGAVIALTRSLARELAPRRIRVNAVAPGIVRTEMSERMFRTLTPDQVTALEAAHPLGFGTPHHVALAVAFLGGSDADWITGHTLVVDGGFTA
jgi:3-oxoacyl-[acyl-carrier protein] reductase